MDGYDLAAARRRAGLYQAEVAKRVEIAVHVLVAIERNEVLPANDIESKILTAINDLAAEKTAAA